MYSGNLNFLEPSGPLQASNGTALPLYVCVCVCVCITSELKKHSRIASGTVLTEYDVQVVQTYSIISLPFAELKLPLNKQ